METAKSLAWIPFGLVLIAGVAFVVIVLLKVVFPGKRRKNEDEEDE